MKFEKYVIVPGILVLFTVNANRPAFLYYFDFNDISNALLMKNTIRILYGYDVLSVFSRILFRQFVIQVGFNETIRIHTECSSSHTRISVIRKLRRW